ncbi:LysE family transporter [Pikeienuella piscinae]|uniref:LysE family transporter n=1 Tax=Pikeienuella piscinae TaxID=2748098 RepID=A0A7M3T672_9RHOB|nr:LysE family transporter [Pikeienuella piscinae]QIE57503.1 LysE family transporter [Pikeienuella piscinae]
MSDFSFLIAPALAFFALAAAPGPATLTVAKTAMASGGRAAAALSAGLGLSLAGWGALAAAGFGPVLTAFAPALLALKVGGGLFLLWLAWGAARRALKPAEDAPDAAPARPSGRLFLRGATLNGVNPKALLAWGAVIALGVRPDTGAADVWLIWALCSALGLVAYLGYSALFARPTARRVYAAARRWVEGAAAALFCLAGLRLLTWRAESP